jgi:hypothetical protein
VSDATENAPALGEFVESLACSWALSYRPIGFPPLWAATYPMALVDVYEDRLVCRGRAQLKRVVPFAVLPLASIERVTRPGWFRRAAKLTFDASGARPPTVFRGDSAEFSPDWFGDPAHASGTVRWLVAESRSQRIDWLLQFLGDRGIASNGRPQDEGTTTSASS